MWSERKGFGSGRDGRDGRDGRRDKQGETIAKSSLRGTTSHAAANLTFPMEYFPNSFQSILICLLKGHRGAAREAQLKEREKQTKTAWNVIQ